MGLTNGTPPQPTDADLTDIAALGPADNDVLQRKASHWTNRTPAQLKVDLASVPPSYARVFDTGTTSLADSTPVAIVFGSERYDTDAYHSNSTNNTRLTVPVNGLYRITGQVRFNAIATGEIQLQIRVNGSTRIAQASAPAIASYLWSMIVTTSYELTAGDYVELIAVQTSGGTITTFNAAGSYTPEFMIERVF